METGNPEEISGLEGQSGCAAESAASPACFPAEDEVNRTMARAKNAKPSAIRYFPFGCGRYASAMTREDLTKNRKPSAVREFPQGCGRDAAPLTMEELEKILRGDDDERTAGGGKKGKGKVNEKFYRVRKKVEIGGSKISEDNEKRTDAFSSEAEARGDSKKKLSSRVEVKQSVPAGDVAQLKSKGKDGALKGRIERERDNEGGLQSKIDVGGDDEGVSQSKIERKRDDIQSKSGGKQIVQRKRVEDKGDGGDRIMVSKGDAKQGMAKVGAKRNEDSLNQEGKVEKKKEGSSNKKANQNVEKKKRLKKGGDSRASEGKKKIGKKDDEDVVGDSAKSDHFVSEITPAKTKNGIKVEGSESVDDDDDNNNTKGKKKKPSPVSRRRSSGKKAMVVFGHTDGDDISDAGSYRKKVKTILLMYDALRRNFMLDDEVTKKAGGVKRPDLKAATLMMDKGFVVNRETKVVGAIPGVHSGDIFYFRLEMCLVGLHLQIQAGIDYIGGNNSEWKDPVASSIIASGGYEDNEEDGGETLIYTGQGGNSKDGKLGEDQKLERGNLALERAKHYGVEVRVIRGMKDSVSPSGKIYAYDGLYKVEDCWLDKGKAGFGVYKYKLERIPGQPELISNILKNALKWKSKPDTRQGLILSDLSSKRESIPVYLVNTVDDDKGPAHFEYVSKIKAPKSAMGFTPSTGCDCKGSCAAGCKCSCFSLNGEEMPYTQNGFLAKWKPMIYECGDLCRCPQNCRNRLSQKGLKFHLEVFKTENRGWGVRSLDPIPAGSFICEYVGEVVSEEDIDEQDEENEYLLHVNSAQGNSKDWGDVSDILPEKKQDESSQAPSSLRFLINARNKGNVTRFINHSCSPNLLLQSILYDHHDTRFPHIMLFAMYHIPPLTELTIDYGKDKGSAKSIACLCGSSACRGEFS